MQEHFHFTTDRVKLQNNMYRFCVLYRLNYRVSRFIFNVEIVIC